MSHDKDRSVSEGEGKNPQVTQTQSFTSSRNRPVPKHFLDDGYPGSGKTKSSSSFCYPSLTVEYDVAQWTVPFVQLDSISVVSRLLCSCTPVTGQGVGKRGSLGPVQALLSNRQKAGMLSTLLWSF